MPYVRDRLAPASKEAARRRVAACRQALARDPASPGTRFGGAYDWFRTALVYARRRSYRTLDAGTRAHERTAQIEIEAARMLQHHGFLIDEITPRPRRRGWTRREFYRTAYASAATARDALHAGHAWLLWAAAQAEKHVRRGGQQDVARMAAEIKDQAAARLIEWAEEMDADDYGQ